MLRKRLARARPPLLPTALVIAAFLFFLVPMFLVAFAFPRLSSGPAVSTQASKPRVWIEPSTYDNSSINRSWASLVSRKLVASQLVLDQLTSDEKSSVLVAGLPRFRANFARDSLVSAMLMNNITLLLRQLEFSRQHQGRKKNPMTGEEFGKIAHEIPGALLNKRSTQYAACDTTALFIIGVSILLDSLANSTSLPVEHAKFAPSVEAGVRYILSHLRDGLFTELPELAGASEFALAVTYWKDSPHYGSCTRPNLPTAYSLAHAMNLRALVWAVPLLSPALAEELQLAKHIGAMRRGLDRLWNPELGMFNLAQTSTCSVTAVASDSLHALYYLEPGVDISLERALSIERASISLETDLGYKTEVGPDGYHSNNVWPFEQAIIHAGAQLHGLSRVSLMATRMFDFLARSPRNEFFEYFTLPTASAGCYLQQWTVAAFRYFSREIPFRCDNDEISFKWVNDNYCDCFDASDEPDTPACSRGKFLCPDGKVIPASHVQDGIADCVDASDELRRLSYEL